MPAKSDEFLESMDSSVIPEGWRPQEGSMVVGKVTQITKGYSDQSESFYPIIVVADEKEGKEIAIHCFHAALKRSVIGLKPKVGERLGIKMGPKIPLKRNPQQSVQTYTVRIDGRTETGDDVWNELATSEKAPPEVSDESVGNPDDEDLPF